MEFLKQKIKKKVLEHRTKSTSTSPERGRAERSPVVGPGDGDDAQATDAPGARGASDPGSPEDGQTGRDGQGDGEQEEERSDYASPRVAPSFPGSVEDEQLSGEIYSRRAELVQKVLEGLRGDAYLAAQDLGVETLMKDGGIETLIATLKKMIFPLFSLCNPWKSQGAFPSRTDATWPLVPPDRAVCDFLHFKTTQVVAPSEGARFQHADFRSDKRRASHRECWFDQAGAAHDQNCCQEPYTFDDYAAILLEHHGRIHLKDSRSLAPQYKSSTNYPHKKGQSKGSQKPWYGSNRTAHWSEAIEETWHEPEEYHGEDEHDENYDEHGYLAHNDESEQPTEWDYVEDDDTAAALVAMAECDHDETPAEELDDLAEAAQQLYVGYMATGTHKGKTKVSKARIKAKAKESTFSEHSSVYRIELSVWQS